VHKLLKEIGLGDEDGIPNYVALTNWQGKLYFLGDWSDGYSIWETDGTSDNTIEITSAYSPNDIVALEDGILFDSHQGQETTIYKTDGTGSGIEIVKRFPSAAIHRMTYLNEHRLLFINTPYGSQDDTLWVTDGTQDGTLPLMEIEIITLWTKTTRYGNHLIFSENSGNTGKYSPIMSDGTPAGTMLVKDYVNLPSVNTAVGTDEFLFIKPEFEGDTGLVFDGTTVTDIWLPGELFDAFSINHLQIVFTKTAVVVFNALTDSVYALPVTPLYNDGYIWAEPILYHDKVYFHGADQHIYETDGTIDGTKSIASSTVGHRDPYLFGFNNTLFYNAAYDDDLVLRAYDLSTGLDTVFALVHHGVFGQMVSHILNVGERLLYKTYSNEHGREWYVYDPYLTATKGEEPRRRPEVFPNPAQADIQIRGVEGQQVFVSMMDVHGKILFEDNSNTRQYDVSNLQPGYYWLKVASEKGMTVVPVIKQ
jgi:hypothetical protein